jgi:hypothetical protein
VPSNPQDNAMWQAFVVKLWTDFKDWFINNQMANYFIMSNWLVLQHGIDKFYKTWNH